MKTVLQKRLTELGKEHIIHQARRVTSRYSTKISTIRTKWLKGEGEDVLFIQGYLGCLYPFVPLGDALQIHGYRVHYVDLPSILTTKSVEKMATYFARYIFENDIRACSIVGHSKGGIIAKYLLKHYPEISNRVRKIITIATPHRGVRWAHSPFPGTKELSSKSPLLIELSEEDIEKRIVSICNTSDIFMTSLSEKTKHGTNHVVDVWGHKNIMFHPETIKLVMVSLAKTRD